MAEQTVIKEDAKTIVKRPKMYKVILLNDDYTTMEFVVEVIISIFHKSPAEAAKIMMDVHQKGRGIVGVYTFDIASTKIIQVEEMASSAQYPLKAAMEEE